MEYRRRFADYTDCIVKKYFESDDLGDEYIFNFVQAALSTKATGNPDLLWKNLMTDSYQAVKVFLKFIFKISSIF